MMRRTVTIERKILEDILSLHAADIRLTGDIVEPIRRALAADDAAMKFPIVSDHEDRRAVNDDAP